MKKKLYLVLGLIGATGAISFWWYRSHLHVAQTVTVFSFLGAPGSGKGTLTAPCAQELNFKVLSTGNLCRAAAEKNSPEGQTIKECMQAGRLVPDEMVAQLVADWLMKEATPGAHIILDGYPRTKEQARLLHGILMEKLSHAKLRIISLSVPREEIIKRLSDRLVCEKKECQAVYTKSALDQAHPVCLKCGSHLIRRPDDEPHVIEERLKVYECTVKDLIDFYTTAGYTLEELNVSGITPQEMFKQFKHIV